MTLLEMAGQLQLKTIHCTEEGASVTGCYIGDLLSLVMSRAQEGQAWLTVQTNINIIAVAVLTGVSCVIVTEGMEIPEETAQKAAEQGVSLFHSEKPSYQLACELVALL